MILITGGRGQGKKEYVRQTFGEKREIIFSYQDTVRELLKAGKDPQEYTERLIHARPDAVIIMDEVGCGIVPLEKEDRIWRDACGRCGCRIAAQADTVVRMICGIPTAIKGELP